MSTLSNLKNLNLIVVITSASINVLVYEILSGTHTGVWYDKELRFTLHAHDTDKEVHSTLSSMLYKVLRDIEVNIQKNKYGNAFIGQVAIFYTEPFAASSVEHLSMANAKEETLSPKTIDATIDKYEKDFLSRITTSEEKPAKYAIIERALTSAAIDDYPLKDYLFRPYQRFSAKLMLSAVKIDLAERMAEVCHSIFKKASISHHTPDSALLEELHSVQDRNYLYAAIFPTTTLIWRIKEGTRLGMITESVGSDKLIHKMTVELNVTSAVMASHAILYSEKKLHSAAEKHFEQALQSAAALWLEGFLKSISDFGNEILLPKIVRITPYGFIDKLIFSYLASNREKFTQISSGFHFSIAENNNVESLKTKSPYQASPLLGILMSHAYAMPK